MSELCDDCGTPLELVPDAPYKVWHCPRCVENGPSDRQIEQMMDHWPARRPVTAPALPVLLPQAFPRDPEHWLRAPERRWFRDGWAYAQTQTRAIPAFSRCSAEELYFAVWSILRGAKLPDPEQQRQPLTRRQREIVNYLRAFRDDTGYMPSYEEIAEYFGFQSLATVAEHLGNLQRKGWIHRAFNEARSIILLDVSP